MARWGNDIESHPKFRRFARGVRRALDELGEQLFQGRLLEPLVRGLLESLWQEAHRQGDPRLGDEEDVEDAARWSGRPGALCEALLTARLIYRHENAFWIWDYFEHCPEAARKAAERRTGCHREQLRSEELERQRASCSDELEPPSAEQSAAAPPGAKRSREAPNGAARRQAEPHGATRRPTTTTTTTSSSPQASVIPHPAAAAAGPPGASSGLPPPLVDRLREVGRAAGLRGQPPPGLLAALTARVEAGEAAERVVAITVAALLREIARGNPISSWGYVEGTAQQPWPAGAELDDEDLGSYASLRLAEWQAALPGLEAQHRQRLEVVLGLRPSAEEAALLAVSLPRPLLEAIIEARPREGARA